jgi:hypothetical protein
MGDSDTAAAEKSIEIWKIKKARCCSSCVNLLGELSAGGSSAAAGLQRAKS